MSSDATETDNTMRAEFEALALPPPDRKYCDHSYPAYSPALVAKIVAQAVAAERETSWRVARNGLFSIPVECRFSRDIIDHYVCSPIRARLPAAHSEKKEADRG